MYSLCKAKPGWLMKTLEIRSFSDRSMMAPALQESRIDETNVKNCKLLHSIANEEKKYREVYFDDCGIF